MNTTLLFQTEQDVRFARIIKFVIPTYLTSLFNTLYTIADGIFVSAYAGTNALAAINTVYPVVNILTGIALLSATGGSALSALHIGAGETKKASQAFSVSVLTATGAGILFSLLILLYLSDVLLLLGATPLTLNDCRIYAMLWLIGAPAAIGKELFTYFIRVDGSPSYSFFTALSGGILNIFLDYIFILRMRMGILGAGLATILGLSLSFLLGIYYFARQKKRLHFTIHGCRIQSGIRCLANGASEFMDQMAAAAATAAFNRTALAFAGEDGIAAVSIIMYLQFIFIGIYFGYAMGVSPLLSYARGNGNTGICQKLEQYSRRFYTAAPILLYGIAFWAAPFGVSFFAAVGSRVYHLAVSGMRLYGLGFLCSGFNIYAAVRLTAYGRGHIAWVITFLRSFALLLPFLLLLPELWGMAGMWLAVPAAELLTFFLSSCFNILTQIKNRRIHTM